MDEETLLLDILTSFNYWAMVASIFGILDHRITLAYQMFDELSHLVLVHAYTFSIVVDVATDSISQGQVITHSQSLVSSVGALGFGLGLLGSFRWWAARLSWAVLLGPVIGLPFVLCLALCFLGLLIIF
ncbi:hypothetical protein Dsin_022736 [Dipteronia sinensis]|uniref:Uncharacterized protein n=1 Tax=Dipteronia sinensis TaxID=43782 RepID=A0AAE0A3E8_9ROSI|nr:hypothetical protein Dsin_022736 [Dipteronia sinensis]